MSVRDFWFEDGFSRYFFNVSKSARYTGSMGRSQKEDWRSSFAGRMDGFPFVLIPHLARGPNEGPNYLFCSLSLH